MSNATIHIVRNGNASTPTIEDGRLKDLNAIESLGSRANQSTLVQNWILQCDDNEAELVREALRTRFDSKRQNAKLSLRVGQRVRFEARGGREVTGTIVKKLRKNVKVHADDGLGWRVSPTLIEVID